MDGGRWNGERQQDRHDTDWQNGKPSSTSDLPSAQPAKPLRQLKSRLAKSWRAVLSRVQRGQRPRGANDPTEPARRAPGPTGGDTRARRRSWVSRLRGQSSKPGGAAAAGEAEGKRPTEGGMGASSAEEDRQQAQGFVEEFVRVLSDSHRSPLPERQRIFRDLQRRFHPDKNPFRAQAATLAFQELMDRRRWYLQP